MRLAFLIDKFQTFQIIAGLVMEASGRGHECDVYGTFSPSQQVTDLLAGRSINFFHSPNKHDIIKRVAGSRSEYDAVLGINLFNSALSVIYENQESQNYAFEYCWNEIYNQRDGFESGAILFCNSQQTYGILEELCDFKNKVFVGSPWFEFLSNFKTHASSKKRVTVLAPHNSMYSHFGGNDLRKKFNRLMVNTREFCDENNLLLSLKTRQKYSQQYTGEVYFDEIISDDDILNHIQLYASSSIVLHFCSSAINELVNLDVPFIALAPDYQKMLHRNTRHERGINAIHNRYYSGDIFDGAHCDTIDSANMVDKDILFDKLNNLLADNKDWEKFRHTHFSNNHDGSCARIMEIIEKRNAEINKRSAIE